MRPIFYPYRIFSSGAKSLARALNTRLVFPDGKYSPRQKDLIICWGAATFPKWWPSTAGKRVLNSPKNIFIAINKLRSFEKLTELGVSCPQWTKSRAKAVEWVANGKVVIARKSLTSSAGRGIVVCEKDIPIPECNLYTLHVRHRQEYRVHVFNGKVIDVTAKRRRTDGPEVTRANSLVRNWDNGWVFCREDVTPPKQVLDVAVQAVAALSLDFGAVDIGYREKDGKAFVFEVNTAPGLEGTTLDKYINAIKELCQ